MLLTKKFILRLLMAWPLFFYLNQGFAQQPGLYMTVQLLEDGCWGVFVEPIGINPGETITGSGQVTLIFPIDFDWSGLTSVNGLWQAHATVVGPLEAPDLQFVSFGLVQAEPNYPIVYVPGQETLLFAFCNDGEECPASMELIDCNAGNSEEHPFCPPNSYNSNPGNDLSAIDFGPGGVSFYNFAGLYGPSSWSCQDCDGDGIEDAFEDTNGNGLFEPGTDSSDFCDPCDPLFPYVPSVELIGNNGAFCGVEGDSIYFVISLTDFGGTPAPDSLGPMTIHYSIDSVFYFSDDYYLGDSLPSPLLPGLSAYTIHSVTLNQTCELFLDEEGLFEIYVDGPISVLSPPDDILMCQPDGYYFSASALNESNGLLFYQWQCSKDGGATWDNLTEMPPFTGVYSDSLQLASINGFTGNLFRLAVHSVFCDTVFSEAAILQYEGWPVEVYDTVQICPGDSAFIHGVFRSEAGDYQAILPGPDGCMYDFNTTLEFFILEEKYDAINICSGDSVLIFGNYENMAGEYIGLLNGSVGCDTILYIDLIINNLEEINDTINICSGDSVLIFGNFENNTGEYIGLLNGSIGCDTILYVYLEINNLEEINDTVIICAGDSVLIFGNYENKPGDYTSVIDGVIGCDTILNIHLQVNELEEIYNVVSICEGDSILIFGNHESEEGEYSGIIPAVVGCDTFSTIWLQHRPFEKRTDTIEICPFDSVFIFGNYESTPGVYDGTIEGAVGCDTFLTIVLEVKPLPIDIYEYVNICPGDSVYIFGQYENEAGVYSGVPPGSVGCDTNLIIVIGINSLEEKHETQNICAGDSILIFGNYETGPGVFVDTIEGTVGCDTVYTIELTEAEVELVFENATICEGDSVLIFGNYETTAGTYVYTNPPEFGCDSVFFFDLTVNPKNQIFEVYTICAGDSILIFDNYETEAGLYIDTIAGTTGCDTIHNIYLQPQETILQNEWVTICAGDSMLIFGEYVSEAGSYSDNVAGTIGCDTLLTIHLSLQYGVIEVKDTTICQGDSILIFGNYEMVGGIYELQVPTAGGCDSLKQVNLYVTPYTVIQETYTICEGDSVLIFGNYETAAGTYYQFSDSLECGFEERYIVKYSPSIEINLTAENSCANGATGNISATLASGTPPYSYTWSNNNNEGAFNPDLAVGTYSLTVTDGFGCTAMAEATVGELPDVSFDLAVENATCSDLPDGSLTVLEFPEGMLFSLDGQGFVDDPVFMELPMGGYTLYLQDVDGCVYEQKFDVKRPGGFELFLPDDMTIQLGDSVQLTSQVSSFGAMNYQWEGSDYLNCTDCPAPWARPLQTMQFLLTAIDENQCKETEAITIYVNKNTNIYVPNAFSPNGDGINDLLLIYAAPSVREVKSFLLFDRWGELVFEQYRFVPNHPAHGWDGQFKGQAMNPAVFVWMAIVAYIDGREAVLKGEVHLLR